MLCLTFPDDHDSPPIFFQYAEVSLISLNIGKTLILPKLFVGCRHNLSVFAVVHVKKTTTHINDLAVSSENEIWFAW